MTYSLHPVVAQMLQLFPGGIQMKKRSIVLIVIIAAASAYLATPAHAAPSQTTIANMFGRGPTALPVSYKPVATIGLGVDRFPLRRAADDAELQGGRQRPFQAPS
jgi:hypothetical protein